MTSVDARGLSCPQPVIMTQKTLKSKGVPFTVIVDNEVAVDNISRFAQSQKLKVNVKEENEEFFITLE